MDAAPESHVEKLPTFGVYVHFPYCLSKCPYCDFLSVPTPAQEIPHAAYADAVLAELERRAHAVQGLALHSVFFGGGTPSLWNPKELGRVLAAIRTRFPAAERGVEVTVECNPGSFDAAVARALAEAGVNRLSLGVQSLSSARLSFLGRHHSAEQGLEAIRIARQAGFTNVSADLIFGVAGQTPEEAEAEALRVANEGVTHVSAYALTIEPGTQFGELARRGCLPLAPDESVAAAFEAVERALERRGFRHYEISNYARPDAEARHNLGYWRGEPYLGLGVGAWGTLGPPGPKVRYRNTPSLDRYLRLRVEGASAALDREGPFVSVIEPLDADVVLRERLMLGLRLAEGVDLAALERETGARASTRERDRAIARWAAKNALVIEGARLRLAKTSWLIADAVIRDLL